MLDRPDIARTRAAEPQALAHRIRNRVRHWTTRHRQGPEAHVFVFSVPRSGSTWLTELIATQGRFKIVNEPCNLRKVVVREHLGISDWSRVFDDEYKDRMRVYLQRFVDDLDTDPRFKRELPLSEFWHFTTDRMLFKILFCGEDDFDWFRRTLGGCIIYLLRHPVPSSLSRRVLPRLESLCAGRYATFFDAQQLEYAHRVIAGGDRFQMAVLDWTLQNAVPLRQRDSSWLTLSYEQMVLDPGTVVSHLARHLSLPHPERMLARMNRISASTVQSSADRQRLLAGSDDPDGRRKALISRWRESATEEQIAGAFRTLEVFGIDFYSRERDTPDPRYLLQPIG
jgi:hypothetical protein